MSELERSSDEVTAAVRRWADDLADSVPPFQADTLTGRTSRPARDRRRLLSVAAAVVVALSGVAGMVWVSSNRTAEVVPIDSPSPPIVDGARVSATATGVAATAGIEVTVEVPNEVLAGSRATIDVTVRNEGPDTVFWQAGGCAIPATVVVGPVGETDVYGPVRMSRDPVWDGDPATFTTAVTSAAGMVGAQVAMPTSMTGWADLSCSMDSAMEPLAPGEQLDYTATAEIRVPPGPLPGDGAYETVASFVGYLAAGDYPQQPLAPVEARVGLTTVDNPARSTVPVDAVTAPIIDDGRLTAWIPTTVIPGRPDLEQHYLVGLTWWRDGWELWVRPQWNGSEAMRVRLDPASLTVVDARIVHGGIAADDEPDAVVIPGGTPDEILTQPISPPGDGDGAGATATPSVVRVGEQITVVAHTGQICAGIALIYTVTADGTREAGLLLDDVSGSATWHTAPEGSPITIPPCQQVDQQSQATYIVPNLAPGNYQLCLTRESDACAPFEIIT
ncbi:MAG: hypothetical protein ABIP99_07035 [Ilumatobacteraceae bacterium]